VGFITAYNVKFFTFFFLGKFSCKLQRKCRLDNIGSRNIYIKKKFKAKKMKEFRERVNKGRPFADIVKNS